MKRLLSRVAAGGVASVVPRGPRRREEKMDKKVRIDSSSHKVTFFNDKHFIFKRNLK